MMLPKIPKFPKLFAPKPRKKMHATTASRRMPQPSVEENFDEPQTNFSSAIIVVLILHLVAIGGLYAFQGIKAHRKTQETTAAVAVEPANAAPMVSKPSSNIAETPLVAPVISKPAVSKTPAAVAKTEASERSAPVQAASVSPITGARVHHVKSGENLTKIAAMYNVGVAEIEDLNGGAKALATLRAGQVLNIPKAKPAAALSKAAVSNKTPPKTYVVVKGDIPEVIARKQGVDYQELLKLNNISDPTRIQVGKTLKLPPKKN